MGIKIEVMVWADAKGKSNKVHGVVEIDENDLTLLIANEFKKQHGLRYYHAEIRNISLSGGSRHGCKVFKLNVDYDG